MSSKTNWTAILIIVLVVVAGALAILWQRSSSIPQQPSTTATTTPSTASTTPVYDQTISDGTVSFAFPSATFGLAVSADQVLVHSYIPPCAQGFGYCLYYIGADYQGTNFESAGVRIQKRPDLASESVCLRTPPDGYGAGTQPATTSSFSSYGASVFSVGDAGAGHYASGDLYRVFYRPTATCYELETRIGATQFANYPAGSIKEFTADDQAALTASLNDLLAHMTLPNNTALVLPPAPATPSPQ